MDKKFELDSHVKHNLLTSIKNYFETERNEQLGDLGAMLILDFFMDELAPTFYNLGVEDAHHYLNEKLEDIFEIQK